MLLTSSILTKYGSLETDNNFVVVFYLTATRSNARIANIVEDMSETFSYGVGGIDGSYDTEILGAIGQSALGVARDVAYYLLVGWIADKIRDNT